MYALIYLHFTAGELGYTAKEIYHFGMAVHRMAGFNSPSDDLISEYCHRNPTVDELYFKLHKLGLSGAANVLKSYGSYRFVSKDDVLVATLLQL